LEPVTLADGHVFDGDALMALSPPPIPFYLDNLIPNAPGAIVLVHGRWGLYKTPLTLWMARSVVSGMPFLGALEAHQASPVLYVEVDTPMRVLLPRIKLIGFDSRVTFYFNNAFNILTGRVGQSTTYDQAILDELRELHNRNHYRIVFLDSLRN
jgi:hypothetical protein